MKHRRKLLKLLTAAGATGAADTWKKPLVNAVSLPAHARLSVCTIDITFDYQLSNEHTFEGAYEVSVYEGAPVQGDSFEDGSSDTIEVSIPVDPGTYEVCVEASAGGPSGSSSGNLNVDCCNDNWESSFSASGDDADGTGACLLVTVSADGGCSISELP